MSECYTLHSGWLERITKDTKGKEKRERLWSVLKSNGFIFFFTDQDEHTGETHIGKLPINTNTVFTRREKEEKKYDGYVFTIFTRDKNIESNVKFKTTKKSSMELWRGYISIMGKDRLPPDLDLPLDCIQDMDFTLARLRRSPREPEVHSSARISRDSGIPLDSESSVTVTTKRTSASGGSGGSGGTSSLISEGRGGKPHKFSNNPLGDDVYPSWFVTNCSREKAMAIFTAVGTTYGNTLMRESAQSTSQGTYVISYCSRIKEDRMPVCDHFKILRTLAGFRIDVDSPHKDMANLTDVMIFFIKLNGSDRTQSLTTNDLNLLGLKDSAYSTYLPNKADPTPRDSTAAPQREVRERKNSEPPPDYDYEHPVHSVPRPKTVTGATIQNQLIAYNRDLEHTKEPARSNRHLHHGIPVSHTVATRQKGGRSQLPPQTRVSMPDPGQFQKSPRAAVSWQNDFHFHPQIARAPVQREETPPSPCESNSVLGYENEKPGFDKVTSEQTMADVSLDLPPPNYKAPAPPPPPVVSTEVKLQPKSPPSFKAPGIPLTSYVTTGKTKIVNTTEISPPHKAPPPSVSPKVTADPSVPAPGIPAPPPPPPAPPTPPIIGSGKTPSTSSWTQSNKTVVTGRKERLSSGDYDDVAHRMSNARRPTAPNIWGMPDGRDRMTKLRSQSVPNLEHQLKGVQLNSHQLSPLNEKVTTSIIQRNPPKSVFAKQSKGFDIGSDRSEPKPIEPGVDASNPGGVGTLSKKFGKIEAAKIHNVNPRHSLQADTPPALKPQRPASTCGQLYANDVSEEDIYVNEDMGDVYINETAFIDPIEYVNTRSDSSNTHNSGASASCVDTSGNPSVEELRKRLNLENLLGSPGPPIPQKAAAPITRNIRDPLPAIPLESQQDSADEIYDSLQDS